jgi:tripartite-type tricarboxylate transporter receptor subunit TctC
MQQLTRRAFAAGAIALAACGAHAQGYPNKPIRLVVGVTAGGASRWWWTTSPAPKASSRRRK